MNLKFPTKLACTLLLTLGCSNNSANLSDLQTAETSKEEDASVPVAVSGGLFLFECKHGEVTNESQEARAACSVVEKNTRNMIKLNDHFSETELSVSKTEGVITKVSTESESSHWVVDYSLQKDISMSEVLQQSKITLRATTLSNQPIEATTKPTALPGTYTETSFLKLSNEGQSCDDACSGKADNDLGEKLAEDVQLCKQAAKQLNLDFKLPSELADPGLKFAVNLFLEGLILEAPGIGCAYGRAGLRQNYLITTGGYDQDATVPRDYQVRKRICACEP